MLAQRAVVLVLLMLSCSANNALWRTFAQKSLCICFGGSWVVCSARDTKQQLSAPGSCPNAANTVAGAAAAELPLERCCVGARCAQKWWRICFGGKLDA